MAQRFHYIWTYTESVDGMFSVLLQQKWWIYIFLALQMQYLVCSKECYLQEFEAIISQNTRKSMWKSCSWAIFSSRVSAQSLLDGIVSYCEPFTQWETAKPWKALLHHLKLRATENLTGPWLSQLQSSCCPAGSAGDYRPCSPGSRPFLRNPEHSCRNFLELKTPPHLLFTLRAELHNCCTSGWPGPPKTLSALLHLRTSWIRKSVVESGRPLEIWEVPGDEPTAVWWPPS